MPRLESRGASRCGMPRHYEASGVFNTSGGGMPRRDDAHVGERRRQRCFFVVFLAGPASFALASHSASARAFQRVKSEASSW